MKLLATALAVVALGTSLSAQAANLTFPINNPLGFGRGNIADASFTDTITFTGLTAGRYVFESSLISADGVQFQSVSLNGVAYDISTTSGTERRGRAGPAHSGSMGASFAVLCEEIEFDGPLVLTIVATGDGKASYGGQISATLVPEPATYALMLGGLGAVGWVARRRRG